jgi:hypothetical protein
VSLNILLCCWLSWCVVDSLALSFHLLLSSRCGPY